MKSASLHILTLNHFTPTSELNYCTANGIDFYIGFNKDKAAVIALIEDENIYMLYKEDLREMSEAARIKGITNVVLITNYGLELHSRFDTAQVVGFDRIEKMSLEEVYN